MDGMYAPGPLQYRPAGIFSGLPHFTTYLPGPNYRSAVQGLQPMALSVGPGASKQSALDPSFALTANRRLEVHHGTASVSLHANKLFSTYITIVREDEVFGAIEVRGWRNTLFTPKSDLFVEDAEIPLDTTLHYCVYERFEEPWTKDTCLTWTAANVTGASSVSGQTVVGADSPNPAIARIPEIVISTSSTSVGGLLPGQRIRIAVGVDAMPSSDKSGYSYYPARFATLKMTIINPLPDTPSKRIVTLTGTQTPVNSGPGSTPRDQSDPKRYSTYIYFEFEVPKIANAPESGDNYIYGSYVPSTGISGPRLIQYISGTWAVAETLNSPPSTVITKRYYQVGGSPSGAWAGMTPGNWVYANSSGNWTEIGPSATAPSGTAVVGSESMAFTIDPATGDQWFYQVRGGTWVSVGGGRTNPSTLKVIPGNESYTLDSVSLSLGDASYATSRKDDKFNISSCFMLQRLEGMTVQRNLLKNPSFINDKHYDWRDKRQVTIVYGTDPQAQYDIYDFGIPGSEPICYECVPFPTYTPAVIRANSSNTFTIKSRVEIPISEGHPYRVDSYVLLTSGTRAAVAGVEIYDKGGTSTSPVYTFRAATPVALDLRQTKEVSLSFIAPALTSASSRNLVGVPFIEFVEDPSVPNTASSADSVSVEHAITMLDMHPGLVRDGYTAAQVHGGSLGPGSTIVVPASKAMDATKVPGGYPVGATPQGPDITLYPIVDFETPGADPDQTRPYAEKGGYIAGERYRFSGNSIIYENYRFQEQLMWDHGTQHYGTWANALAASSPDTWADALARTVTITGSPVGIRWMNALVHYTQWHADPATRTKWKPEPDIAIGWDETADLYLMLYAADGSVVSAIRLGTCDILSWLHMVVTFTMPAGVAKMGLAHTPVKEIVGARHIEIIDPSGIEWRFDSFMLEHETAYTIPFEDNIWALPYLDGDQQVRNGYSPYTVADGGAGLWRTEWEGISHASYSRLISPQILKWCLPDVSVSSAVGSHSVGLDCVAVHIVDPLVPHRGAWAILQNISEWSHPARNEMVNVLNRYTPIAVNDLRVARSATLTLLTKTLDHRSRMYKVLYPGRTLLLQFPRTKNWGENALYVMVSDVSDGTIGGDQSREERKWTFPLQIVSRPEGLISGSIANTWDEVVANTDDWVSWTGLAVAVRDWETLVANNYSEDDIEYTSPYSGGIFPVDRSTPGLVVPHGFPDVVPRPVIGY
jgi:hypothetical protein